MKYWHEESFEAFHARKEAERADRRAEIIALRHTPLPYYDLLRDRMDFEASATGGQLVEKTMRAITGPDDTFPLIVDDNVQR